MPTRSADEIMREMRQIRRELRDDVAGIVDQAQTIVDHAHDLTDWRYYVRNYPVTCLGVAVAAGYLLIPTRVKVVDPKGHDITERMQKSEPIQSASWTSTILGTVGGLATTLLLQGVSSFARQQLESVLEKALPTNHGGSGSFSSWPSANGNGPHTNTYESQS